MFNTNAWLKIACCCSIAWTNCTNAGSVSNAAAGLKAGNANAGSTGLTGGKDGSKLSSDKALPGRAGCASSLPFFAASPFGELLPLVPLAFRCGALN